MKPSHCLSYTEVANNVRKSRDFIKLIDYFNLQTRYGM